jgi:anti-sigma B factor antagonist
VTDEPYGITRQRDEHGVARVCLTGEFDMENHDALAAALLEAAHDPLVERVIVDLSGTTFMDSSGFHALIVARMAATAANKRFEAVKPTAAVRRIFEILELRDILGDE